MASSPKKKKPIQYSTEKVRVTKELREQIRLAYLTGKSIEEICRLFKISKNQFNSLRTKYKWKETQKEIERLTEEQTIDILVSKKSEALLQIANDAMILMGQSMKRLKDESEYEDIVIENEEGNIISRRKTYSDMYALARTWNLGVSRLLRALGEPDVIRDLPVDDSSLQPVFKVLVDVGLRPEYKEKLINGEFSKNGTKSN
jgi:hypothetical protein